MSLGQCKQCEYSPVAFGAKACPNCGARNPNPAVTDRIAGRSMLVGILGGMLLGGVLGFFKNPEESAHAFAGALLGGIAGFILGLVIGLMLSFVAWMSGKK